MGTRGNILPGELGTGSGSDIAARRGRLVKGGCSGCGCFCVKATGGNGTV